MLSRRSLLGRLLAAGVIAAPLVANIMPSEVEAQEAPSGALPSLSPHQAISPLVADAAAAAWPEFTGGRCGICSDLLSEG